MLRTVLGGGINVPSAFHEPPSTFNTNLVTFTGNPKDKLKGIAKLLEVLNAAVLGRTNG